MKIIFECKVLFGILMIAVSNRGHSEDFIGYAYDLKTKELLYTEHHQYQSEIKHHVIYKEVTGEVFAEKTIDYRQGFISPNIEQENFRNGEYIKISNKNKDVLIEYKENSEEEKETNVIGSSSSLVVDAGFDHFISQNWESLLAGKEMTVEYIIPSLLEPYRLSIRQYQCDEQSNYCFSISASNFFISLFSDQLRLSYDKSSRKLASFQGKSNICDESGHYQNVKISYQYAMPMEASL